MLSFYLMGIIVLAFIAQLLPGFTAALIFNPALALSEPWRFVTSIFLHGGVDHIFFNLFAMLMFAPILESRIGTRNFAIIFFAGGIIGSVLYYLTILVGIAPPVPALGASGAIYAILGALAVIAPDMVVFVMFIPLKMRQAAVLWVVIEFLGTFNTMSGIASAAHLGGLILGLAYAQFFLRRPYEQIEFYK